MRLMKMVVVLMGLLWMAGCTFESTTVLTQADAYGDAISGFPEEGAFRIESYDRAKLDYAFFATGRVEKSPGKGVRYVMSFNDSGTMELVVQARKISDDNYLVRYFQVLADRPPELDESGLVFARHDAGTYYVLTGISSQAMLDKVFSGEPSIELSTSVVRIENDHQAERISNYFRDHFADFPKDQDYARLRIAK